MKHLSLIRHGKSSWEQLGLNDKQRPLLNKGIKRTLLMAEYLVKTNYKVDLILSSPAERAKATAMLIGKHINPAVKIIYIDELYPGNLHAILGVIEQQHTEVNHLLILGHNPGFTNLANYFASEDVTNWLPTSAFVSFCLHINNWESICEAKGDLLNYITPKLLKKEN